MSVSLSVCFSFTLCFFLSVYLTLCFSLPLSHFIFLSVSFFLICVFIYYVSISNYFSYSYFSIFSKYLSLLAFHSLYPSYHTYALREIFNIDPCFCFKSWHLSTLSLIFSTSCHSIPVFLIYK